MKTLTRTIEIAPSLAEIGAIFGAANDYDQADCLAAALAEMGSPDGYIACQMQARSLAQRIPADSTTARWLRDLVAFIDDADKLKAAHSRGEGKDHA